MPDTNEDLESLCQRLSLETRELRDQLRAKDEEIASLRHRLSRLEAVDGRGGPRLAAPVTAPDTLPPLEKRGQLDREDVERYSRQVMKVMIVMMRLMSDDEDDSDYDEIDEL